MSDSDSVVHSRKLPENQSGELFSLSRNEAQWEWMSFFVHRLQPGEAYRSSTDREEAAFVVLGGTCLADWGQRPKTIGQRKNVFDGLPYTVYLPAGHNVTFTARTRCEIAECRVPSTAKLEPCLIT